MELPFFANALSTRSRTDAACEEVAEHVLDALEDRAPDLLVVFASRHHAPTLEDVGARLQERIGPAVLLGCMGESVIGGAREVEGRPALTVLAGCLPGTEVRPFRVSAALENENTLVFRGGPEILEPERSSLLMLGEPTTFPMDRYLEALNEAHPGVPAVGGMASGGLGPGESLLLTADGTQENGAIGIVLEGDIELRTVVSQGCRPVGKPYVITSCERNLVQKLGGRPAAEILMETHASLSAADKRLMQAAPFLGIAIDARRSEFTRGDFLVRGILGLRQEDRSIAVGELVRRGQTVQFMVRDAESAGEDLKQLLLAQGGSGMLAGADIHANGALLFSCNGRGTRMFQVPDHDASCVRSTLETEIPLAGFFANGEIGPVGGRNFLHGFTASVAIFRNRSAGSTG